MTGSEIVLSAVQQIGQALVARVPFGLLLGQDAWSKSSEPDRVLELALARLNKADHNPAGWAALVEGPTEAIPTEFYGWLAEKYARRPRPRWLDRVPEMPWSVIATTSIDPTVRFDMRIGAREPTVVLTGIETPVVTRSIARPPLYYLFGIATETDPRTRPPSTRTELRARQQRHASTMLNHLTDAVTSVGLLLIDGYTPTRDWLEVNTVLSVIEALPSGHVIWFGLDAAGLNNDDLSQVLLERKVTVVEERLGEVLEQLELSGVRLLDIANAIAQPAAVSLIGKGRSAFVTAPELRVRVEAAAAIVDDSWTSFLPPLVPTDEYERFRRFHGSLCTPKEYVEGVRRDFTISRDAESRLQAIVSRAVDEHATVTDPIVVAGQSGSGKSVALARAISYIREKGRAAVLYARTRLPNDLEVDDFCVLADSHGASATVLVCDLNLPIRRYRELLTGLRSAYKDALVELRSPGSDPTVYTCGREGAVRSGRNSPSRRRDSIAECRSTASSPVRSAMKTSFRIRTSRSSFETTVRSRVRTRRPCPTSSRLAQRRARSPVAFPRSLLPSTAHTTKLPPTNGSLAVELATLRWEWLLSI